MESMVNDAFGHWEEEAVNATTSQALGADERLHEHPIEDHNGFSEFLNDANQTLYEGSRHTKLEFIIKLYHIKFLCGLSDKAMTMILDLLRDAFHEAKLPPSFYEAKKIITKLGLNYTKIDACLNDCMLYLEDDDKDLQTCKHYGTSRWNPKKKKKQPAKVLRYFPLKPRLQRLFMCCKAVEHMRWHVLGGNKDGLLRHPRDGEAWKAFDLTHPEFALDPRNVRFQNPLKSAPQPQQDANPLTQAQTYSSPTINLRQPSPSIEVVAEVPSNVSPPIDFSPTNDVSQEEFPQEAPTSRRTDRESSQHWNIDAIEGVIKKIKIKVREVNNLPSGEHIIVEFDDQGQEFGNAQGLLAGFCGILATDCNLFPINFERWSGKTGMPKCYFDDCYLTILKELCRKNKEIRSKQKIPHTGGSKSNARRRHEMLLEIGQNPSRGTLFIEIHKRKDGSYVNDAAKTIGCKQKLTLLESQLQGTLNALKAYMIMKERKIPDELASFFLSQPSDVGSEPESSLDARGSSGGNNLNSQSNI
uniref:Uncharacterized protein n=1 Tax=Cajanus cajan TaxID=3821 RepID=A0A151QSQ9_CAJCA|nr:hypothetical protein KK1_045793 [Cajanus cajan]